MSSTGLKIFFSVWYSKVILPVIAAILIAGTLFLMSMPYRAQTNTITRIEKLENSVQATEIRLKGIETNVEWMVRQMGGNP